MSNSGQNNLPVQSHGRLGTYIPPKHSGPERKNDFTILLKDKYLLKIESLKSS